MNPERAVKFDNNIDIELETKAMSELDAFLASPNSIGLDNIKESLRNVVQLMMELKGYETGYALQHLANGEHSYLAMSGTLKDDERKKRKEQELIELMKLIDQMFAESFAKMYTHVEKRIETITENIEDRIDKLDETIENAVEAGLSEQLIEKKKKKRRKLKHFKKRVEERKEELEEVDTAEEIIKVEIDLKRDIDELRQEVPKPKPTAGARPNPFETYERTRNHYYDNNAHHGQSSKHNKDDKTGSSGTGDKSSGSKDDGGDSSSGKGEKDKGVEPPPTPDF